jgi:hypothetical protein
LPCNDTENDFVTDVTVDAQRGELPVAVPLPLCVPVVPVARGFVSAVDLGGGDFVPELAGAADFTFVSVLTAVPPAGFADCVAPAPPAF